MKKIIFISTLISLLIFEKPFVYGQSVGISANGATPKSSAMLDVDASSMTPKKGLLIPRVQLTSRTDNTTISSPATSLMVYNNGTAGTAPNNVKPGYYYWDGAKWSDRIGTSSPFVDVYRSTDPTIVCNDYTTIVFDIVVEDTYGIYDNATGRLNLPAGVWQISASVFRYSTGAYNNQIFNCSIFKNNAALKLGPVFNSYLNPVGGMIDAIVSSNGTDYFDIRCYYANCGGNATLLSGSNGLWMQAVKISN